MKKVLLSILITCGTALSILAQEKIEVMRYEYQLTFPAWTIGTEKSVMGKVEIVYLDIYDNESRCMSAGNDQQNELSEKMRGAIANRGDLEQYQTAVNWSVFNAHGKLNTYLSTGLNMYSVEESSNEMKWTVVSEVEEYNGMKVQKATGELSGRTWTVWFTQDIPLIEGPYKFKNLPGFVVKAEDSTGDYKFELLKSEKVKTSYWLPKFYTNATKVNKQQWNKIRSSMENKNLIQMLEERGTKIDINSINDKSAREEMTRKFGRDPNPIEFY
ncbi:MAG: GLPGLI family protein [Flavobacterium sp.]